MSVTTTDLAAWLTQIWDEEEAAAVAATEGPWLPALHRDGRILGIDAHDGYDDVITTGEVNCMSHCYGGSSTIEATDEDWRFIAANHPASVLARIAADRKILARYERAHENRREHPDDLGSAGALLALLGAVNDLASAYADRPGFREEMA